MHDFADARTVNLVGPLYSGAAKFDQPVIYVDGGAKFQQSGVGLSVGDGDSYAEKLDEQLNPHKNYSDLAYVLASLPAHFHKFILHGFLGARRDHEWANLGEAHKCLKHRHQPTKIYFDSQLTGFSAGKWQLSIEGIFSLLCVEPIKAVLQGDCRYELSQATHIEPFSSHGLSNVGHGNIVLEIDQPAFIVFSSADESAI